ncbi:MAG: LacI family DNA-binding transcriptional regulator [Anaerorhabdus sp.]|uniref:LacI family DNA-binding transcriptional regulator n=1 Tax=Anaerorhabdus sp. TaxID=1872524 RepID=UPI003A87F640
MSSKLTINDIARLSATSKTTVSFYLNGKTDKMSQSTQERIKNVIEKTNYQPNAIARSLNAKSMQLIGVIIGDITNTFANQIVKGIDDVAKEKDYQLIIGNSNYDFKVERQYIERMLAMGVDGFIVQPTIEFELIEKELLSQSKPIVYIDSQSRNTKGLWVKTNNYEAVLEATEGLIAKGYTNFIMITADPSVLTTRMERARGFKDALALKGVECKTMIISNDTTSDEIKKYIDNNIKDEKTCVFVPNCWGLPKVFLALKDYRHLIPDKLGLLGFDNLEWTEFSFPTVSTIVQPAYNEGEKAARILIDRIEGCNEEAPNQILKCHINFNESTK